MSNLKEKLDNLDRPIKVGMVGAGYMASGTVNVINQTTGMKVSVLYDPNQELARKVANNYGNPSLDLADSVEELCRQPIDVVVDGTCDPILGAEAGYYASENGKHLVSVNIEADVTIGPALKKLLAKKKKVYTVTAGDEPGELKNFYDHYTMLNFEIIACGKGKNNPLNVETTPEKVRQALPGNGITAEQVVSFIDGSKTMFEMACLSNATGLLPDVRGMHGPKAGVKDMLSLFKTKEEGGLLNNEGVVDYVTGTELSGGVFIIVKTGNKRIQSDFEYLKIGQGPYYLFYQPKHNWFIDLPLSIGKIIFEGEPTLTPLKVFSQVFAVAKRSLKKGEEIDGIGGYATYGLIEKGEILKKEGLLPLGLAKGARIKKDVKQGIPICWDDVEVKDSLLLKLYQTQDED